MYNKIETNDDGDISMKHVVIHLKGGDSAFEQINCTKKMLTFPSLFHLQIVRS